MASTSKMVYVLDRTVYSSSIFITTYWLFLRVPSGLGALDQRSHSTITVCQNGHPLPVCPQQSPAPSSGACKAVDYGAGPRLPHRHRPFRLLPAAAAAGGRCLGVTQLVAVLWRLFRPPPPRPPPRCYSFRSGRRCHAAKRLAAARHHSWAAAYLPAPGSPEWASSPMDTVRCCTACHPVPEGASCTNRERGSPWSRRGRRLPHTLRAPRSSPSSSLAALAAARCRGGSISGSHSRGLGLTPSARLTLPHASTRYSCWCGSRGRCVPVM